jgi:predicted transcriptional regulator
MTNALKFIDLYNELDHLFAKALNQVDYIPFREKIRELETKDSTVRRYSRDLVLFGNLRNAISHKTKDGVPIAEPIDSTISHLSHIVEEFKNPKRVIPAFQFDVFSVTSETPLINLLKEMKAQNFSQAPVLDANENVIEVISTNTIARWLNSEVNNQLIDLTTAKILDLMPHIETKENYILISRNTSVYEAAELFIKKSKEKKSKLDCMMITHSGKPAEKLMGIVCIEDIAEFLMD